MARTLAELPKGARITDFISLGVLSTRNHKYDDILLLHFVEFYGILYLRERRYIMPRISPFNIVLTHGEKAQLETITRKYTSPYCDIMRAKVILLAADGLSNKQIGQRLDLPRQIVSKWRKRFFEQRLAGLQERPRRGRPRSFPP